MRYIASISMSVDMRWPSALPAIMSMALLCRLGAYMPHSVPNTTTAKRLKSMTFS